MCSIKTSHVSNFPFFSLKNQPKSASLIIVPGYKCKRSKVNLCNYDTIIVLEFSRF
jgi:hypothetical protein